MLVADDDVRDYGNPEKAEELREQWDEKGFNVISMKNDFRTIYGEDVVKTGEFHWAEELADDRGDGAAAETAEDAEGSEAAEETAGEDIQYVMYLGTNDKDTNEPVFTQEESMDTVRNILIDHFGGYTIQEANGGWINENGEESREYTLVIYLSDTTLDEVHAAADDLLKTFNQSSVLIQTNPTQTEFYAG